MDLLANYGEDDSSPPENDATDTDTKHSDTVSPRFGSVLDDEWASFEKMIAGDGTSSSTQEVSAAGQFLLNDMISYPGMGATNCWQRNEDSSSGVEQSEESHSLSSPDAAGIDDADKCDDDQEDIDAFFLMRQRIKERERSSESDSSDSSRSSSPSSSRSHSPEMFIEAVKGAPVSEEIHVEPPQSLSNEKINSPAEKQMSPAETQKSPAEKQKSPVVKQKSPVLASRSPERKRHRKRSRSQRSRSRNKKKSRKRSKSREKHRSSKKHKRSRSQSRDKKPHSSHSRHKDRKGSRERKRSKSRERKDTSSVTVHRSRSKERKSSHSDDLKHSQNKLSKERDSKDRGQIGSKDMKRSHSKERKKSRSPERKHKRSRSRERKSQRNQSKERRSHSRERRSRSRSRGRQRSSRSRSRSRSPNKPLTFKEKMRQQLLKVGRMLGDSSTENTTTETKEPPSAMALNTKALFEAAKSSVTTGVTPQMALLQTMAAMHQKAQEMTGIAVPKYYNPAAVNPLKYAEQVQKRKLLWSKTKDHKEEKEAQWQSTAFALDNDGKMANKFRKLMGMKENEEGRVPEKDEKLTDEQKKKQDELFLRLDKEYEFARMATHTHRGIGLGFQSQTQTFPPNTIK
ncbi:hypothetical protein ACJMK2_011318 [Sinanodonta woodiana]|uniref:Small acidic protein-like domain-containing protein n=1 Tax=Sinanodonta woodiana TaxID=1069815 RepID=A0ABD3V738_SINWO